MPVHRLTPSDHGFGSAIAAMIATPLRGEVAFTPIPAPARMAPHTWAASGEVLLHDEELASGRLVVLYDPRGNDAWQGRWRLVALVQAQLEPEFAVESMLGDVAWSWVTESLELADASAHELGATTTRVVSQSYGALASRPSTVDVEMRVSWTPDESITGEGETGSTVQLAPHFVAWSSMLAAAGGLPPSPAPIAPLIPSHRARSPRGDDEA